MEWGSSRSIGRALAAFCLAGAMTGAIGTSASPDPLHGRAFPPCKTFDRPAALALDKSRTRPIAFARDRAVVAFPKYGVRLTMCHAILGVTSVVAVGDDSFWIAHDNIVDHVMPLKDGGSWIPATLRACAATDRVEAVARNRAGQLAVAVTTGGDASKPRLLVFDRLAHDAAKPLRTFASSSLTSLVDDVAFDTRGSMYVYDDAGEIVTFAADASGADVRPSHTLSGPQTELRPAFPGVTGTRHLVVDAAGDIAASDTGVVITFAPDAMGDAAPTDVIATAGPSYGIAVTLDGGLFVLSFGRVDSYAPIALRVDKSRSGIPSQSMDIVK